MYVVSPVPLGLHVQAYVVARFWKNVCLHVTASTLSRTQTKQNPLSSASWDACPHCAGTSTLLLRVKK
ncbi:hypothetical protein ZWY2020_057937 [Hordeum vulgare]|nr:hypothetical protein ZWY2020_057937 [Hordeum vulgare]